MPIDMVSSSGFTAAGPQGQIRKEFPESWVWTTSVAKYVWHVKL